MEQANSASPLMNISTVATAFATVVLVVVTALYVWFTHDMVKEMRAQLEELKSQRSALAQQSSDLLQEMRAQLAEMESQRLLSALPLVDVTWNSNHQSPGGDADWTANMHNHGPGPALDLQVSQKVGEEWEEIDCFPVVSPGGSSSVKRSWPIGDSREFKIVCKDTCDRCFSREVTVVYSEALPVKFRLEQQSA